MLSFSIKDIIDILLVAMILYYIYRLMKESRSGNVFMGILIFVIVWIFVSKIFNMSLLGSIMDKMVNIGAIALIIIFQEDIRKFFSSLGTHHSIGKVLKFFSRQNLGDAPVGEDTIIPVVRACMSMSAQKVGALIVFERYIGLGDIEKTGEIINAEIKQRLIENIFFKNSPLHDGAMVISHKKIVSAGCILPVSHDEDIPRNLIAPPRRNGNHTEQRRTCNNCFRRDRAYIRCVQRQIPSKPNRRRARTPSNRHGGLTP